MVYVTAVLPASRSKCFNQNKQHMQTSQKKSYCEEIFFCLFLLPDIINGVSILTRT